MEKWANGFNALKELHNFRYFFQLLEYLDSKAL